MKRAYARPPWGTSRSRPTILERSGRRWLGAALILLTIAASPVAFLMLAVVLVGIAAGRRHARRDIGVPALAIVLATAAQLVMMRLFPAGTLFFSTIEAAEATVFCLGLLALTWRTEHAQGLRGVLVVYLLVVLAVYAIPNGLGHDIVRLRELALPLALIAAALSRWRPLPLALAVVALGGAWNIGPFGGMWVRSAADRTSQAAVWQAPAHYLRTHLLPGYRVEAVDTGQHWPTVYLPSAGIPIVRGWFREYDQPVASILFRPFTAAEYVAWLRRLGVAYVVLTKAQPDFSSRREAALVRSGRAGLHQVFNSPFVSIYAVPRPRAILTGPGRPKVLALRVSSLVAHLTRRGAYRVAVRWSPYWKASTGCLSRAPGDMLRLRVPSAATVRIAFDIDASSLFDAFVGTTPSCRAPAG